MGGHMKNKPGRPRSGVFSRHESLSVSVTEHEKAVFRAIAAKRGITVSALMQPLLIKFADELYHSQNVEKELVTHE
jgi:hypothetical protein